VANESLVIYSINKVGRFVPSGNKMILRDISLGFYYAARIGVLGLNSTGKVVTQNPSCATKYSLNHPERTNWHSFNPIKNRRERLFPNGKVVRQVAFSSLSSSSLSYSD